VLHFCFMDLIHLLGSQRRLAHLLESQSHCRDCKIKS
jgi:hypothetical protein